MEEIEVRETARRLNLGVDHVARDMIQARFVSSVFAQAAGDLVLKGGLAMRAIFGSSRFTKDVDLQTAPRVPMARVSSVVRMAIKEAMGTGFLSDVRVTEPKQTDTVQRWKIGARVGETEISMTVEVSRRGLPPPEHVIMGTARTVDGRSRPVYSFSASAIAAGKVAALVSPNRVAPRDVYDLDLLIRTEVKPPIDLLMRMGRKDLVLALDDLWPKLELMTFELASESLLQYLPKGEAERLDEPSWEERRIRTGQAVEGWLREALAQIDAESKEGLVPVP